MLGAVTLFLIAGVGAALHVDFFNPADFLDATAPHHEHLVVSAAAVGGWFSFWQSARSSPKPVRSGSALPRERGKRYSLHIPLTAPMGELVFIGLGLHDEKGITLRGLEEAQAADLIFAELYTSRLVGASIESVGTLIGKPIRILGRTEVEDGRAILEAAKDGKVAFLVPGDPMAATTHVDLRLRAARAGVRTRLVHGVSILTAAAGALGLQLYKFGRTTTVPWPRPGFAPTSPLEAILENRRAGLHTLVLLDLREDGSFLSPRDAVASLLRMAAELRTEAFDPTTLACVLGRVGSPDGPAFAGPLESFLGRDLGPPPHCIVIPGTLHFLEKEALAAFAGAQAD